MAPNKTLAMAAVAALTAASLGACSGGGDDNGSSGGNVTMQLWMNSTTGPGKAFWDKTAADFEKRTRASRSRSSPSRTRTWTASSRPR